MLPNTFKRVWKKRRKISNGNGAVSCGQTDACNNNGRGINPWWCPTILQTRQGKISPIFNQVFRKKKGDQFIFVRGLSRVSPFRILDPIVLTVWCPQKLTEDQFSLAYIWKTIYDNLKLKKEIKLAIMWN